MTKSKQSGSESGFSLVELLVAMTITLIVSGAIYGLMTGGQRAFQREPELTDRQQNARLALSLIERDVAKAGAKFALTSQAFTNNLNDAGPLGLVGNTDILETVGANGECPDVDLAGTPGANVQAALTIPDCFSDDALVMLFYGSGPPKWGFGHELHAQNKMLNFPPGQQPDASQIKAEADIDDPSVPIRLGLVDIIRYEVANVGGVPNLYRSARGGINTDGDYVAPPDVAGGWQLVARGVEDLQVRYQVGADTDPLVWADIPGVPIDIDTAVRRVEVTLSARSMVANLPGQMPNANLGSAVRGQLVTVVSPRAALLNLQGSAANQWR